MSESGLNLQPKTLEELIETVGAVTGPKNFDEDGYEASANALWQAAVSAFNYVAHVEGVTGFQAGFAALMFYGQAMHIEGPYAILKGEDVVYPQYDLVAKAQEYVDKWQRDYGSAKARELLAKHRDAGSHVHPDVLEHWEYLAALEPDND